MCNSWDSTLTGTTAGCTGACKPKIADGQPCSQALLTGGQDDQCASNKCLELLKNTCSNCRYCQPRGGSTDGQRCKCRSLCGALLFALNARTLFVFFARCCQTAEMQQGAHCEG
jgi:hypothetical protein